LRVMANIAEEALAVRENATGEKDYGPPESERWRSNWMGMFDEEMPPVTQLIRSARETADAVLASLE